MRFGVNKKTKHLYHLIFLIKIQDCFQELNHFLSLNFNLLVLKSYFQNIMIVGIKSQMVPSFVSQDSVLNSFLAHKVGITIPENTEILTDEYAPVEFLSGKNLK